MREEDESDCEGPPPARGLTLKGDYMISLMKLDDMIDVEGLQVKLATQGEIEVQEQVFILRNALTAAMEELGRIHQATLDLDDPAVSPNKGVVDALFTSLYYVSPPDEREEVWNYFTGDTPLAQLDEEV